MRNLEKGRAQEQSHSEFSYAFNNYKDYDYDGRTTMDEPEETLNWIGVKQQFFSSVIEAKTALLKAKVIRKPSKKVEYLKKLNYEGFVSDDGKRIESGFYMVFHAAGFTIIKIFTTKI